MWKIIVTIVVAVVSYAIWYIFNILRQRKQLDGLPQPPMLNLLMGHLHIADECQRFFPKLHPHVYFAYIRQKYNLPEIFYLDWRPFGPVWIIIVDPEVASKYVSTTQSLPKSPNEVDYVDVVLGAGNMVTIEGAHHKHVRSMFNPGFSLTNIMTLVPQIIDDVVIFRDKLLRFAETNQRFEMEEEATQLTIDVIGRVTFDVALDCQKQPHKIARLFRQRLLMMRDATSIFPWEDFSPIRPFRLWLNQRRLNAAVNEELDAKIRRRAVEHATDGKTTKKSSIDLALNAYEKEIAMGNVASGGKTARITLPEQLPASLRADLVQSIKAFIFAGHDTSSSVISWTFYMLHRYSEAHKKVVAELDDVFGPATDIAEKLRQDPYLLNKLEYLTAVVRETMRIFPPASTLRWVGSSREAGFKDEIIDPKTGQKLPLWFENHAVWPVVHAINRNTRFFPEPTKFVPERFLQAETPYPNAELFTPAGKDAFRPFEKGPRNCIGQELAMVEIKTTLAVCIRNFDFIVEYPGEEADPQPPIPVSVNAEVAEDTEYGRSLRESIKTGKPFIRRYEGHRPYQVLKGSAKPAGGIPGRIYVRK